MLRTSLILLASFLYGLLISVTVVIMGGFYD